LQDVDGEMWGGSVVVGGLELYSGRFLVAGLGGAALTHRYRVTGTSRVLQRTGGVVFGLLLSCSVWVLIVGVMVLCSAQ
jgi:hypothetical protein